MKAAFDNLNRQILIKILRRHGVNTKLVNRIAQKYEETSAKIRVNGLYTKEMWKTKGVRQGCPISPTLFSLYIADLEQHLEKGQTGGVVIGRKNSSLWHTQTIS